MANEEATETKEASNVFNLEEALQKENKYLRAGFPVYIKAKGYDVNTQKKYDKYMKEYKEA
jgi:hypothetical protein